MMNTEKHNGIRIYPTIKGWEELRKACRKHHLMGAECVFEINFSHYINKEEDSFDYSTYRNVEEFMPEFLEVKNTSLRKPSIVIESPIQKICRERGITYEQWENSVRRWAANLVDNEAD